MTKLIVILTILLASTSYALAWDVSPKQNGYDKDNTPKSYTLSGDTYGSRRDNQQDNRRDYSRSSPNDSTRGSYETQHQINNNGLIINKE